MLILDHYIFPKATCTDIETNTAIYHAHLLVKPVILTSEYIYEGGYTAKKYQKQIWETDGRLKKVKTILVELLVFNT